MKGKREELRISMKCDEAVADLLEVETPERWSKKRSKRARAK
jgi:hypothetical protein